MTINEILIEAALYHQKTLADLTVAGQNIGLSALNKAMKRAELLHDFNFNRKMLTLAVNTVTGGSLTSAVIQGSIVTTTIKTILDIGLFDTDSNFIPVEWTTTEEGYERQREDNRFSGIRYPSDGQVLSEPLGGRRVTIVNNTVAFWPKATTAESVTIGIDASCFSSLYIGNSSVVVSGATGITDFNDTYYNVGTWGGKPLYVNSDPVFKVGPIGNVLRVLYSDGSNWFLNVANFLGGVPTDYGSIASTAASPVGLTLTPHGALTGSPFISAGTDDVPVISDPWQLHGSEYLLWSTVDQLNRYFKTYIPRQEGNIPSPVDLAQAGLAALLEWDNFKYEAFRRHGR